VNTLPFQTFQRDKRYIKSMEAATPLDEMDAACLLFEIPLL
jgi:hypothetical protein